MPAKLHLAGMARSYMFCISLVFSLAARMQFGRIPRQITPGLLPAYACIDQGWKGGASAISISSGRSAGALRSSSARWAWSRVRSAAQPKPRARARKSGV